MHLNNLLKQRTCVCLLGTLVVGLGCQPAPSAAPATSQNEPADAHAGHDHGDLGPHGGHLLHLSPTGVHAEWTHDDDTHLITVYLDDFDVDKVSDAKFVVTVGDEIENFDLESGEEGWSISSEALMNHINMGDVAEVQLVVSDDTGDHTSKIEAHEHHHH